MEGRPDGLIAWKIRARRLRIGKLVFSDQQHYQHVHQSAAVFPVKLQRAIVRAED
jgi:hypothetical protein